MSRRPKFKTKLDQELYVQLKQEYSSQNEELASTLQQTNAPTGTVAAFTGTSAPSGWLLCNGTAINRIIYSSLFSVIGTSHGYGDNSTTFNLPDYRGRFLRGFANGSTNDPDRASRTASALGGLTGDNIGTVQADAIRNITGQMGWGDNRNNTGNLVHTATGAFFGSSPGGVWYQDYNADASSAANWTFANLDVSRQVTTGNDVRPRNITVNYIIKF